MKNWEPLERDIQKSILEYLTMRGHFVWRNNTGVVRPERGDGSRGFFRAGKKGSSDILGVEKGTGRIIAIEVKRSGGRATSEQLEFLREIVNRGGAGMIAFSVDDVKRLGL